MLFNGQGYYSSGIIGTEAKCSLCGERIKFPDLGQYMFDSHFCSKCVEFLRPGFTKLVEDLMPLVRL